MDKSWSTTELARATGKTAAGIWFLIKTKKIKAVKIGRDWRIPDDEANRYIKEVQGK